MDEQRGKNLPRLVEVMQRLLAPGGCPWDREQTLESLRAYVIEEAHEVVDAIDKGDPNELREELGDLLLQVVFQAELARSKGWFGPDDVVDSICEKLIRRHPHVFADLSADTAAEVLQNWETIKSKEKANRGRLAGVPRSMPALLRAQRVGEKAGSAGYDWANAEQVRKKVDEELAELDQAREQGHRGAMEAELGDVFFALASLARHHQLDAEASLRGALDRFTKRFEQVELQVRKKNRELSDLGEEEREQLWEQAKQNLYSEPAKPP